MGLPTADPAIVQNHLEGLTKVAIGKG